MDEAKRPEDKTESNNPNKPSKKSSASEAGKKVAGKVVSKQATSKVAGGTSPAGHITSGMKDAGKAIENKDGMGVADAAVKTGAVAAATAYGGTIGGAVTSKVLETKAGKKLTRTVSWIIVISVIAPFLGFILIMTAVMGMFGAVEGSFRGSGPALSCVSSNATTITDSTQIASITSVMNNADTVDNAVIGTMVFLTLFATSNSSSSTFDSKTFFTTLSTMPEGGQYQSAIAPWVIAQRVNGSPDPTPLAYSANYEVAYLTVLDILAKDTALATQLKAKSHPATTWISKIPAPASDPNALPLCDTASAFDAYGNLIDTGNFVSTVTDGPPLSPKYQSKLQAALDRANSYVGHPPAGCRDKDHLCISRCDELASLIWGYGSSGYNQAVGDKLGHWPQMALRGQTHPGDANPPIGALLFWTRPSDPGSLGHVAVYVGTDDKGISYVVSNWYEPTNPGVWRISLGEVARDGFKYLGWTEPIFQLPWI